MLKEYKKLHTSNFHKNYVMPFLKRNNLFDSNWSLSDAFLIAIIDASKFILRAIFSWALAMTFEVNLWFGNLHKCFVGSKEFFLTFSCSSLLVVTRFTNVIFTTWANSFINFIHVGCGFWYEIYRWKTNNKLMLVLIFHHVS